MTPEGRGCSRRGPHREAAAPPVRDSPALLYGSVAPLPFRQCPRLASLSGSVAPHRPACAACLTAGVARRRWFATGGRWRGPVGAMDVGELLSYQVSSAARAGPGLSLSPAGAVAVPCAPGAMLLQLRGGRGPGPARPHSVLSHGLRLKCRYLLGLSPQLRGSGARWDPGTGGSAALPVSFWAQMGRLVPGAKAELLPWVFYHVFFSLFYDKTRLIHFHIFFLKFSF